MRKTVPAVAVVAVAVLALLFAEPAFATSKKQCFDATVTGSFWNISSSVNKNNRYVEHTGNPNDSDAGKLLNLYTSTTSITRGTDHKLELDGAFKDLTNDTDWYRNSTTCATLTVTPLSASVTFPKIYGVCGPKATLEVPLTFVSEWKTSSSGYGRYMPKMVVKPRAAANLSCGIDCLAEVWGGLWANFELTIKPYVSKPGDALERTVYLQAGPHAGANLMCLSVWGWKETLVDTKVVLDVKYL